MQTSNDTTIVQFHIALSGTLPLMEGFETATCPSGTLPNANWNIGGFYFQITSTAAASGVKSCMLNNLINVGGNISVLETNHVYDMTTISSPTNADKLQIFTSTDCGLTWQSRKVITATTLATLAGGTSTSPYIPTPSQFTTYTVTINAVASSHNVMFRWEFLADPAGPGNNLYLDNINIASSAAAGIEQITNNTDIVIYPNPTKGMLNVELRMFNENTNLQITDILGNTVKQIKVQNSQFTTDISDLNEGVYNVSIISNEGVVNKRVVIVR